MAQMMSPKKNVKNGCLFQTSSTSKFDFSDVVDVFFGPILGDVHIDINPVTLDIFACFFGHHKKCRFLLVNTSELMVMLAVKKTDRFAYGLGATSKALHKPGHECWALV